MVKSFKLDIQKSDSGFDVSLYISRRDGTWLPINEFSCSALDIVLDEIRDSLIHQIEP